MISSPAEPMLLQGPKLAENVVWMQEQMRGDERNEGHRIACVSTATERASCRSTVLNGR